MGAGEGRPRGRKWVGGSLPCLGPITKSVPTHASLLRVHGRLDRSSIFCFTQEAYQAYYVVPKPIKQVIGHWREVHE